jgi:L-glyceraldehyde 3-phosphate reductase
MTYRRCGRSGLLLPAISLGLWQNFGDGSDFDNARKMMLLAFERGITCFDLANNYGPSPGSAEKNFGRVMASDLAAHRDEMVITTKAGYTMWDGPYGDCGSRKYLIASCDQSLRRMGLDYVDIFYSHRHDPLTPLEETMGALDRIVRSGRALYAGLSNYPPEKFVEAVRILRSLGTPCLVDQIRYSMLVQERGDALFGLHDEHGVGCVSFSPLAQGVLTNRYLNGIPKDSRASRGGSLQAGLVRENLPKVRALNEIAAARGQSLAEMAIAWQLTDERVTSVIVGVSSPTQLEDNLRALENTAFSAQELEMIAKVVNV